MVNKKWGRLLSMAMAATLTVTSVPLSAHAEEVTSDGIADAYAAEGYTLKWNDEFNGESLDTSVWNVEQHEPGWVNAELQRYTDIDGGNIKVSDGALHIISKYDNSGDAEVTEEGEKLEGEELEFQDLNFEFDAPYDKNETSSGLLQVNFGKIDLEGNKTEDELNAASSAASVILKDISITDTTEGTEVLRDTAFENGNWADWSLGFNDPGKGSGDFIDGQVKINIENAGSANWNIQLQQAGLVLVPGHHYVFSMKAVADKDRYTEITVMDHPDNDTWDWWAGSKLLINGTGVTGSSSSSSKQSGAVTSGRITTQNKMDFTYGRFEARARVPEGKGLLPAFWLMATDEGLYGQWPKCGEIDIMEVMGQNTSKSYHTIHYGYNNDTHKENQGTKVIGENGFSNDYHVFRADWEPGKITWFVDGEEVYATSSWYTGSDDANRKTYPAPFDQNFYVILNLAVGGSWVGYPDDLNNINDKTFDVDYVRVYQKDDYSEAENSAVAPVEETVSFREPIGDNYLVNSDFASAVDADENNNSRNNWVLHLESDAEGSTATVSDGAVKIVPSAAGDKTYSVQLKQAGIPMYNGWEYELSFDAYADEERDIVVDVSAPDRNWSRYLADTTTKITTENQTYTYTFTVNDKNDPNGSLEINLGNLKSTAPVTISNIKLVHKSGEEIAEDNSKVIRPDGNYVYNGSFDEGEKRLGYWEVEEEDKAQVSVTNTNNKRELLVKVEVPEGASEANPVTISQSDLAPLAKGQYDFSFSAYTDGGAIDGLTAKAAGSEFTPSLTTEKQSFSNVVTVDSDLSREESNVEFTFTKPGTYYLDDVFLTEKSLLKNGSFNAGTASYKVYVDNNAKASYVIDSMNGNDNTFAMTIEDTDVPGAGNDWYIQLNQDGIKLEESKYYAVGFKAKSSINRKIKYCVQHNGEVGNDWTEYCGHEVVEIGSEWKEFSKAFQMSKTDNARFNITMGSVDGLRITDKHDVYIDDITLVEITKDEYNKIVGNTEETPEEPGTEPTETPAEEPSETPAETPAEEPTETPAEEPTETPAEEPTETPSETPEVKPEETPEVKPEEKPEVKPEEKPEVKPEEKSEVKPETKEEAKKETKEEVKEEVKAPSVKAEKKDESKIQTKVNNNGKADKGEVRVSDTAILKVTGKSEVSYQANPESTKEDVHVPDTAKVDGAKVKITKLVKNAFKDNTSLTKVTLGKNIKSIGKGAFSGCTNLKKITVKATGLKKVYKSAFKNCKLDKDFKVIIYAADEKSFEKVVKLFKKAGLKDVTFVYKEL